jgi:hypothetical protein
MPLHILKIVFVQDHSVVFEAKPTFHLAVSGSFGRIEFSAADQISDAFVECVGVCDIALVKLEVHCQSLVRDAGQAA